jgi:hypothetical protein
VAGRWGALFAHVAFWDRLAALRWERWLAGRALVDFDDAAGDLVNDAGLYQCRELPLEVVRREVMAAAEAVDAVIAAAPAERVAEVIASGRRRWAFRSAHRDEHLGDLLPS